MPKVLHIPETRNIVSYPLKDAILRELKARQWTTYRLAKEVRGKVSRQSVYGYLHEGKDMTGESVGHLLAALGLKLEGRNPGRVPPKPRAPTRKRSAPPKKPSSFES